MKKCLLLLFTILTPSLCIFAQPITQINQNFLEPSLRELLGEQAKVKAVKAKEYELTSRGARQDAGNFELFEFDSLGHLVRQVAIENHDTSLVRDLHYTEKGSLAWEVFEDKIWEKRYKAGYRFNQDQTVFQVKSYELVNEKSALLLDTRHYRYDEEGRPIAIFSLANEQVNESQHFSYDEEGRLLEELFKNADGELVGSIKFVYDEEGRQQQVIKTDHRRNHTEEFMYTYNPAGKISATRWLENGKVKGSMDYSYDESGETLLSIRQTINDQQKHEFVKEFAYEFFN
jgi:hypothetical protein